MPTATPARPSSEAGSDAAIYEPGALIAGKYRLEELIGEGGMGEVWLAQNTTLHVDVAIKLIRAEIAGSEEAAQRLLNEARAAAGIEHHAIVRVHDFGSTEHDDPFIVMELLKGRSLDDWLAADGTIPAVDAVSVLLPVLGALSVAHPKGIVHRDLKPDNIFLAEDERGVITPKLVDFGIAKTMHWEIDEDEVPVHFDVETSEVRKRIRTRLTQMGQLLGSPEFMSPEQVRGDRDIDGRADVWGVGVVLYDALTGRRPFQADSDEDMLLAILAEDPEPIEGLDPELWEILGRALEKSRDRRWPNARAMGESLARWLVAQGVQEDVTGRSLKAWIGSLAPPAARASTAPTQLTVTPAQTARGRGRLIPWIVATVVLVGGLVVAAVLTMSGGEGASPPAAAADPAADPVAPAVPTVARAAPEPSATATLAASGPVEEAAPDAGTRPRVPRRRPVSKPESAPPVSKPKPTKNGELPIPDDVTF